MMKVHALVALVALGAGGGQPQALSAQNVSELLGTWESTMETPRGTVTQEYIFTQDGDALTGTVNGRGGPIALQGVRFVDGLLTFSIAREMRGTTRVMEVSATLDGDVLAGTVSGGRGGSREFSASRKPTSDF